MARGAIVPNASGPAVALRARRRNIDVPLVAVGSTVRSRDGVRHAHARHRAMLRVSENPHCCAIETFRGAQDLANLISRNACDLAKGTLCV
jgi:hypothetical protein